jgi:hypothetical protein
MGRVAYNHSLYRTGYRPYGKSNAFAAAQGLSGTSMPQGVFGPWRLSGDLGQSPPFTRSGGYKLHGLAGIVPDQSIVTYTGTWTPTYFMGANDIITAVSAALAKDGLNVKHVDTTAGFLDTTIVGMTIQPTPFNVTLQIQVANGQGYGDPNDIVSIVNHEVYVATGAMPVGSSMPIVQAPGGAPTPTGQPMGPGAGVPGALPDLGTWFQQNIGWIALGIGAALVLPRILP